MTLKERIEIIEKIQSYHPAANAGRKREWSTYIGGMADTGTWYAMKMIKASEEELRACLEELIEEFKPSPPIILSEEDQRKQNTIIIRDGIFTNQLEMEKLEMFYSDMERSFLWGKGKPIKV